MLKCGLPHAVQWVCTLFKLIIFHIHYFPHTVHYCCSSMPFWNASIFTKLIVLRSEACSDWPAIQCVVIGRIPQACDGNVTPPYSIVMPCPCATRLKPIINEAFVASSGDIITDYNGLYCLFMRRVASRLVNITMSAFVIGETTNNKHYSTRLKTHVWIVRSRFFKYENILTGCESEAKLELLHFIETVFVQTAL